ncbi:hypothetical protein [Mycobacteroides abscessus]|uniref:hypothetical protein n=1 Tax=Mycobacteroides abscessus TaxID=36809 RepID=UPI000926A481|nr:hypothetical protein [Mycobacteroides abscessus]MBN7379712.1 hypothetical protein [Mycobacteroides abscessus subsp. massiliense]MDM2096380.1 hypothetical protein [Mycobacteroides abscessus]MDM2121111.1 hypothetical protein [Mycobacteroides abscessus]MDM2124394.1 hypothetical protein [Mycobacteroides abscessus]MDM2130579.1 hypothetical protein [Mycobacteroides abscessus]
MDTRVYRGADAEKRLAELDLEAGLFEKVLDRAEAEVRMCTKFDPPSMGGITRWGRTIRFMREELCRSGWTHDNPRNISRTIHPERRFAIVVMSGNDVTGSNLPGARPSKKYPLGGAMQVTVETNGQQLSFFSPSDLGVEAKASDDEALPTWFLLYRITPEGVVSELSFPSDTDGGGMSEWVERIILGVVPIDPDTIDSVLPDDGDDDSGDAYEVDVNKL